MGGGDLKLVLRCPQNFDSILADPEPDWDFDDVLRELGSLELKLSSLSKFPVPFTKAQLRNFPNGKSVDGSSKPFVMRVFEDDADDLESEDEAVRDRDAVGFSRFNCDELFLSDDDEYDSEDESRIGTQPYLMEEMGLAEGALFEQTFEHRLGVKEEIRNKISALETKLKSENDKSSSAFLRVEKYREARRENDRKLDIQYQRKIAEALDDHLTVIQRDHELRSQIEERKISAAIEGAKRKEKALLEEKLRQEKAKAEAEAKLRAEEAKRVALEAQIRAQKEAALKEAAEAKKREAESKKNAELAVMAGEIVKAAESAVKLEKERLKILEQIDAESEKLGLNSNKEYIRYEKQMSKIVQQISATREVVSKKAAEVVNLLKNSPFPQLISCRAFARKITIPNFDFSGVAFARAYVILLVSAEVPHLMNIILAELHRACIYTVPKHIMYSELAFASRDEYYKAIGFKAAEGKIESVDGFIDQLKHYIQLYGALVQTEISGFQNPHGLKEGWAWLARFLNTLPPNRYSAVALHSFLHMAGYGLYRKYRSQFRKVLAIVSDNFLKALKDRNDAKLSEIITNIRSYIQDSNFQQEPEGRSLGATLLSEDVMTR